jgi:hypothetical protein
MLHQGFTILNKSATQRLFKSICILCSIVLTGCAAPTNQGLTPTQSPESLETPIPTASIMPDTHDLDLREANVTAVEYEDLGEGSYRFTVTLFHDDDGEAPSFADWWQVEDESGTVLGRRVLLHSHSTHPFSRSETIAIPADISSVIIRGHDMLHGYGGQSMRLDLRTGELVAIDEGAGSTH